MESSVPNGQKTFDIDKSNNNIDVYNIRPYPGGNARFVAQLTQKNYNESDPTCFSVTLVRRFKNIIPDGYNQPYNYMDSVVSTEKQLNLNSVCFDCSVSYEAFVIVDGIWKDNKTVEPYTLTMHVEGANANRV